MADTKNEPSEAEIAAKTGFGEPASAEEEATETDEATENNEESDEEAEDSADSKEEETEESSRENRAESKDADDETDESNETDEDSEEDESEDENTSDDSEDVKDKQRTVPYSLLKSKNAKIRQLEVDLQDARDALGESTKSGDDEDIEEATKEVEASAKDLAKELGMDEEGIAKILKAAVKLSSKKSVIPKDIAEKLKTLDDLKAKDKQSQEVNHFNNEWKDLEIGKKYPNAPKSAVQEAQKLMDELAHSKEHHKHDLDYILYKNKNKFESILKVAAKGKSGETGKRIGKESVTESSDDESEELVDIENLTPAVMKARDAKELEMRKAHSGDKDYRIYNPKERD